jgi:hypothetical protein
MMDVIEDVFVEQFRKDYVSPLERKLRRLLLNHQERADLPE